MKTNLFNKINPEKFVSEHDVVLIALSGGADSIFLAEYFISIRDKYSLTLKAAHIEHGIRGEESLSDCNFVEEFCKNNDIECFTLHINAPCEAKKAGQGVEEYSRNKRYEFFNSIACDKIATAHNLSDNVETLIFRLARGTALKGLCGIPAVRGKIIRPLLDITGKEIRACLDENEVKYCIDSTNHDDKYSRNHIRKNIVPQLSRLNDNYENAFKRLIEIINEDNDFIEKEAERYFNKFFKNRYLSINAIKDFHISIIKRIIIKFFNVNGISLNDYKINEIMKLLDKSGKVQLSGNIYAVSNKRYLRIANLDAQKQKGVFSFTEEKCSFNDFLNKCEFFGKKFDFYCDCDKIVGSVAVRSRESGDKISPANRGCTKPLKKLFNELEIPVEHRDNIPVITDDNGIIGIYGYTVDERVKVSDSTKSVLILNVLLEDNIQ